jgi:hypothetical protein
MKANKHQHQSCACSTQNRQSPMLPSTSSNKRKLIPFPFPPKAISNHTMQIAKTFCNMHSVCSWCIVKVYFVISNKTMQIQYVNDNRTHVRDDPQVKNDRDIHMRRDDIHIYISSLLKCIMHLNLRATIGEHFNNIGYILQYFSLIFTFILLY